MRKELAMNWRIVCVLLGGVVLLWPALVDAQEAEKKATPAAAAAEEGAQSYTELRKRWEELNKQAEGLIDEFRTATAERKKEIRQEFQELMAEHEKVVRQLSDAAAAEYKADPKKNTEAAQLLADLAADLVRRDRYEEALALIEPLLDNNSEADGLYSTAGMAAFSLNDFDAAEKHFAHAKEQDSLGREAESYSRQLPSLKEKWGREQELRTQEAKADDLPRVRLTTSKGEIVLELFENEAPNTVANFISLVEKEFYNGVTFHRVLPGFMAQGGDPSGDGTGGPGYTIECECDEPDARMHFRGSLSMAKTPDPDTGGSQFFLTFRPTPSLDTKHTVFGRILEGFEVLPEMTRRDPSSFGRLPEPDKIVKAEVIRKRDHEYTPKTLAEKK
jgi:cyclophilin family peptidyl-prolyl cis-trans isomerase